MNNVQNEQLLKEKKTHAPILWGLFWLLVLLFVDQLTKTLADVYFIDMLGEGDPLKGLTSRVVIIPGMLELCISYNRGIAFSMFSDAGTTAKMAIVLSTGLVMLLLSIVYCLMDRRRTWVRCALILIIAGGLGNLIDRVYYQVWDPATAGIIRDGVRDMVYLNVVMDFGACNFADFFICIGAAVLIASLIFFDQDAICPLGKYKVLSKEAEEREKAKKAAKQAVKQAEHEQNNG